jgi:hypothetical protein
MSDIYINEATGKKIKVYRETWVHVWDDDCNDNLNFWDTAEDVAEWCMEGMDDDYTELDDDEKCEYCGGDCPHLEVEDEDTRNKHQCDKYHDDDEGYYLDFKKYFEAGRAYHDKDWEEVITLSGCRYCNWDTEERWVVEEVQDETKV